MKCKFLEALVFSQFQWISLCITLISTWKSAVLDLDIFLKKRASIYISYIQCKFRGPPVLKPLGFPVIGCIKSVDQSVSKGVLHQMKFKSFYQTQNFSLMHAGVAMRRAVDAVLSTFVKVAGQLINKRPIGFLWWRCFSHCYHKSSFNIPINLTRWSFCLVVSIWEVFWCNI